MPIIGFILIQLVVFGILVYLLKSQWSQSLERATHHVSELEQDLARKTDDAQKRLADANRLYDEAVQKARADSEKNKVQILREAQESAEKMILEARAKSGAILEEGKKARQELLGEVQQRIESGALEKAASWVGRLVPEAIAAQIHESSVESFVKNEFQELKRLHLPEDLTEAVVTSAYPLSAAHKKQLADRLTGVAGRKIEVRDGVDRALIAGLKVTMGSLVLDSSLQFKVRQMVSEGRNAEAP